MEFQWFAGPYVMWILHDLIHHHFPPLTPLHHTGLYVFFLKYAKNTPALISLYLLLDCFLATSPSSMHVWLFFQHSYIFNCQFLPQVHSLLSLATTEQEFTSILQAFQGRAGKEKIGRPRHVAKSKPHQSLELQLWEGPEHSHWQTKTQQE